MTTPNISSLESIQNVSRETFSKLVRYHELLLKWQKACNLVSPSTIPDSWNRHFVDSFQLLKHIDPSKTIVDMGSGAGFPGMVLAIAGCPHVTLIESDSKKVEFLKNVSRETFCEIEIIHSRIENVENQKFDIITSRALSSLDSLLYYSSKLKSDDFAFCLFPKGENWNKEIDEAKQDWRLEFEVFSSTTNASSSIIRINEFFLR